ncbi:MAG TPA: ABC transporter substrate-binding protein [Gaiellaceae bacterium]|nr:ABC transporter substrate-binding protein [Gaiellaceae bacterium]
MKEQGKWRVAALLAFVLVVVAAIGAGAARSAMSHKTAGGIIVDGTTDSVTNIDPAGNYDFGSGTLDYQIFQHLLEAGPGGLTPHPVLATKCGFRGNLKTFACTLRKGVKFHNGKSFTSADVVWSFDRVVRIKDPSGIYTLLSNLKSVKAKGKYGVVFNLKAPQATWPQILTTGAAQIVPKRVYPLKKIKPNSSSQIGTGPYQLKKFSPGQQAVLQKFKGYWGKPAKNDGVIIRYYTKSSTMKLALTRKDIDMAFRDFTPTELVSLQKTKGIVVHKGSGASIRYLVLNLKMAPTDKLAVRKAIAYLMPRQTIAKRVYHGLVKPLYSMVAAGLPGHIDAFKTTYGASPSLAKARAALNAAGVRTPVNITLWYTPSHYGDSSADEFAEIKRGLEQGNLFNVTLKSAEWAQYSDALGKQYGAFQLGWFPDYVDGENYLLPFYDAKSNFTSNNYNSAKMNALLAKEQATKALAKRIAFIKQAQTLAAKDAPIIPYWQAAMVAVSRNNVKNIGRTLDPTFIMRFWLISK